MKRLDKTIDRKRTRPIVRNESGIALVTALLSMALLTLMGTAALTMTDLEIKISANDKSAKEAFYIAEAGIEHAWAILRTASFDEVLKGLDEDRDTIDDNGILRFGASVPFAQGAYEVRVTDNDDGDEDPWNDSDGSLIVTSTGASATGPRQKIEVVVRKIVPNPIGLRGAVTSNGNVLAGGNMQIDGRDHNIDGVYIQEENIGLGNFGVNTTGDLNQMGSEAVIGGTVDGIDYEPDNPPENVFVIKERADREAPETPEAVLGLKEDQLKTMAMNGINGSQYVTDPRELSYPLKGITYVELPNGDIWDTNAKLNNPKVNTVNFDGSKGILVVHNQWINATIHKTSHGTFRGIIIADEYETIRSDIIGAVVTLSSEEQKLGTAKAKIKYSNAAIDAALKTVSTELTSLSWREGFKPH